MLKIDNIKTVAVIGAGTMGQGIAQVCAAAGFRVLIYDVQEGAASAAVSSVARAFQALVDRQKITRETAAESISRIVATADFQLLKADIVIEAVVERLEVKRKLFLDLEEINDARAVFVSNTSSIPITRIGSVLKYSNRFAGLHFFNPAPLMKLVEVIKGSGTEDATVELLFDFCRRISKHAVLVQDSPGFIVNRVARHYYVEALKLLEENVTGYESIDRLMRSSGFRMGPFELMDLIGIDVNFSVTSSLYESFHEDPKFRPSRIQQQKVDAKHLGRKTGKGFYDYGK